MDANLRLVFMVIFGPCFCRLQIMLGARGVDRSVYGPYLLLLEPEQLAVLAMHRWGGRGGGH